MAFGNVNQNFDEEGIRKDEREKVLDDVKDAIDEFMILNAKGHALHYELWEVIEKVRQAGSP